MAEIKPTQKPVPSNDVKDLLFNSGLVDEWATSLEKEYIDRFGVSHLTAAGMEWAFKQLVEKFNISADEAIRAAGYILLDSFQQGVKLTNNELTLRNQALRDERTGEYYRWNGELPKQVLSGSTPEDTGGIGAGAWVGVGDAALRGELAKGDGSLTGVKQPYPNTAQRTQKDKNAETISLLDYFVAGESDWTGTFQRASLASRDLGKQVWVPARDTDYEISDSIPLYDDGFSGGDKWYYKGNGSRFIGESLKTVIRKTKVASGDINAIFVSADSASKRGLRVHNMSLIDMTEGSAGIDIRNAVVNSHFTDLFIQTRRIGLLIDQAFVNVKVTGVIVQGHDDEETYPLLNGISIGVARAGTSYTVDSCHVGRTQGDAYTFRGGYSKIGVLSCDNIKGINYNFIDFKGTAEVLGAEWYSITDNPQQGTFFKATSNTRLDVSHITLLNKVVESGEFLFDINQSQIKISQVEAYDGCIFDGAPATLANSGSLDITYFTQYKYNQFKEPSYHNINSNTYLSVGNLAGTQYKGRVGTSIHHMLTIPNVKPQTSGCYRIMGTKSIAQQVSVLGTIYSLRGLTSARSALMMDVCCNGNGIKGTSVSAIVKKVSDPVGKLLYNSWFEANIGTTRYMLLRMADGEDCNMGEFFTGVTAGRDPNLFRIVTQADVTDLVESTIGSVTLE